MGHKLKMSLCKIILCILFFKKKFAHAIYSKCRNNKNNDDINTAYCLQLVNNKNNIELMI